MGNGKKIAHHRTYINVMELLVSEEVERQIQNLPRRVFKYVNVSEVETFALNRLPALYACSEKGLQHQRDRANRDLGTQIVSAVRQAFAAVQVDPIRLSQPLELTAGDSGADAVLQALREWLGTPDLTWKLALYKIERLREKAMAGQSASFPAVPQKTPAPKTANLPPTDPGVASHPTAWRPGTYGSRIGWKPQPSRHKRGDSASG